MISIIICSRTKYVPEVLNLNISKTIGSDYELVVIDNSKKKHSIFSAYNEGVRKSKGDILCFMHDDILFHSLSWGQIVESYFLNNPNVGLIGVVGSHFMPTIPSAWWDNELLFGRLLQGSIKDGEYIVEDINHLNRIGSTPAVAVVDGMWLCFPRQIFNVIDWDESLFDNFHGYDIDISFQVWDKGFDVHVIEGIKIEHKSLGVVKDDYYDTIKSVYKKWSGIFPFIRGIDISDGEINARTRLVEVKHELRERHIALKRIINSKTYRLLHKIGLIKT